MKKQFYLLCGLVCLLCSCSGRKTADLIFHNAVVYTVDSSFSVTEAIAIKDGKIIESGTNANILAAYEAKEMVDANGKFIFPGFIDAHCHFYNYGLGLDEVDLVGTRSFDEVVDRIKKFEQVKNKEAASSRSNWIIGRGWDQNDWLQKDFPDRQILDSLFPDRPVFLKRIDGHAALANQVALALAHINKDTKIEGGVVEQRKFLPPPDLRLLSVSKEINSLYPGSSPSGILIDNAVDLVERVIPQPAKQEMRKALLRAQQNCFAVGLTTVDDAGLMKNVIDVIDEMHKSEELKIRVYAMLSDSAPNYQHYLAKGPYKTERLNVCSFKYYGDGALGSRGACLKREYADMKGWSGFMLRNRLYYIKKFRETRKKDAGIKFGWQYNVHAIGDSTVHNMLLLLSRGCINCFGDEFEWRVDGPIPVFEQNFRRNRIEHLQIIDPEDLQYLKLAIPSVQPTHATSDMYWARDRLGAERVKYAYAYKTLLKHAGIIALGTDFPVEDISPFKTFYAAVFRKDAAGYPEGGFQMEEALSREETIKGMTIWAAYANFEEREKGSIENGKYADLVILDTDLMKAEESEILKTRVLATYVNGQKVYSSK